MKRIHIFIATISRFFVSSVFLVGAVKNILNWHETEKEIMDLLFDWQSYASFSENLRDVFSFLIPWTPLLQVLSILLMFVGGILVLWGVKKRLGMILLIVFLIPVTILCHPFWFMDGSIRDLQAVMFLKNLSILGCLMQQVVGDQEIRVENVNRPIMNLSRPIEFE